MKILIKIINNFNIELRRMIKHFFKERDCVTMVRPVEDELLL